MMDRQSQNNLTLKSGPWLFIVYAVGMLALTIWIWGSGADGRIIVSVIFLLSVCALLIFGKQIWAYFDLGLETITIKNISVWKKSVRVIPFFEIGTVAVTSSSSGLTSGAYGLILVLNSGEQVPLTAHASAGKRPKEKKASRIAAILNRSRTTPVQLALNGVFQTIKEGTTQGRKWQIMQITANDITPVTRWFSRDARFPEGFILAIPASRSNQGRSPNPGKLGKSILFFYRQYLRNLMISDHEIPGFEQSALLDNTDNALGKRYTFLTNDPVRAMTWLTDSFIDTLISGNAQHLPVDAGAGRVPHLLVTPDGMHLIFKHLYYQAGEINAIAEFGVRLVEAHPG